MKQTSSALTFLMAQYRAIFKRAYVKGIATAVLLTAGLAAGQAQAAITWGTTNDTTVDVTISDSQTESGGKDVLQNGATLTVNNADSGLIGSHNIDAVAESGGSNFTVFDGANTTFNADRR